ncbi:MAG: 5-formyltetrahydrofolate cyclo-ligase [Alphaproteobacteria bacterium]|nr:5-formyltetrahydrofolate cyclo-ligase [Alphaproteobacteria bacterium]
MDKPALRARMKIKRRELASAFSPGQEAAFTERMVKEIHARPSGIVAGYAAFRDEIPVWHALEALYSAGWKLALPCTRRDEPLTFRSWKPGAPLVKALHGISEPMPDSEAVQPDVIIVPLLAFDRTGHRLGYGGGHYDRTLAMMSGKAFVIGAAYAGQEVEALPVEPTDCRMDAVITERQALFFV